MSKELLRFESANVHVEQDEKEIKKIAEKARIKYPSSHLGFFKTVYARIGDANKNGVRLAREAVENSFDDLIGAQCNFEHYRQNNICGHIIDAWINSNDEIIVVYAFYKSVYPEAYDQSLELLEEGKLAVSFELMADRDTQVRMSDGTILLNDITFQGLGHLMQHDPAEPTAKVFEFAKKTKENLVKNKSKELVYASKIEEECNKILLGKHVLEEDEMFVITTTIDKHFHIAKVDWEGNGETISGYGEGSHPTPHKIRNWQVQETESTISEEPHAHPILDTYLAELKEKVESKKHLKEKEVKKDKKKQKMEESKLNEEQLKQVKAIRDELGDIVKDAKDEDLLDEAKVAEFKKQAEEAKKASEKKSELEEAKEKISALQEEVDKLTKVLESKDSEIETVRENAEKIATLKIELKENPHVAEFSDEDYLDETKVERAKEKKELDDLKAKNAELAKSLEEKEAKVEKKEKKHEAKTGGETNTDPENIDYTDVIDARVKSYKNKK